MTPLRYTIVLLLAAVFLESCSSSYKFMGVSVAKRKYSTGYTFITPRKHVEKSCAAIQPLDSTRTDTASIAVVTPTDSTGPLLACLDNTATQANEPVPAPSLDEKLTNNELKTVKNLKALYASDIKNTREFRQTYKKIKREIMLETENNASTKNTKVMGMGRLGVLSLILGIIGLFILHTILGLLAIIFGVLGVWRRPIFGILGIILGIIDIGLGVLTIVILL